MSQSTLKTRDILRLWLPLLATWLLMAAEGPYLVSLIARLEAPVFNLAAWGVAYAFALVAEAPVIALILSLASSAALALALIPPFFTPVAEGIIGLSPEMARLCHSTLICLIPWPAAIGIRRFYQGVLIRGRSTRRIALGTGLRLVVMGGTGYALFHLSTLDGARIGGIALSAGVLTEMIFTRFLAGGAIARILALPCSKEESMNYRALSRYYFPLALTPVIGLAIHPMVTFFLGRSASPLESLAVMPVLYGLTFIFRAVGLSYQEVAIALIGSRMEHRRQIIRFGTAIALGATSLLALIAMTPLCELWFRDISGLSPYLAEFARPALLIMVPFPALTLWIGLQRSMLLSARVTVPVSVATAIEAAAIFILLLGLISGASMVGVLAASVAYIGGRLLAILFLRRPLTRVLAEMDTESDRT